MMRHRWQTLFIAVLLGIVSLQLNAHTHVAKTDETLQMLARYYYGTPDIDMVIRAANGCLHPDDGSLMNGEHVNVPGVIYHRAKAGEDWYGIAAQYLGTTRRGKFLAELNGSHPDSLLDAGRIIKVPYQLLYILAPNETLKSVAKMFLGPAFTEEWLQDYNLRRKKKYGDGDALLVPLLNIEFPPEAREAIDQKQDIEASEQDRLLQQEATQRIAKIRAAYESGKYIEAIAIAQQLLGTGRLANPQKVGIYRYLAFSYAAFDEMDMVRSALNEALKIQPGMELSPITTSPKILRIFQTLQQQQQHPSK